jgi:hypothetical protein
VTCKPARLSLPGSCDRRRARTAGLTTLEGINRDYGPSVRTFRHEVTRLVVDVGQPYDDFRQRYEEAVPALDKTAAGCADRSRGELGRRRRTSHGGRAARLSHLLEIGYDPADEIGWNRWWCVEYLMGNHAIAERMFRHDPLRDALRAPAHGDLCCRRESHVPRRRPAEHVLLELGNAAITEVGVELDGKLAALLAVLGAAVPAELTKQ